MKGSGFLFTAAVLIVGWALFAFALSYNLLQKGSQAEYRVLELDRVTAWNTNIGFNLQRGFRESMGLSTLSGPGFVSFSGALPANLSAYNVRMGRIGLAAETFLENTSVMVSSQPLVSYGNLNFTQVSDTTLKADLPQTVEAILLSGSLNGNISGCNLTYSGGDVAFSFDLAGNPGACSKSAGINISSKSSVEAADGIVFNINERTLYFTSIRQQPLNYTLTVRLNETETLPRPYIGCQVTSSIIGASKTSQVMLE